jgi:hypothetical protein
VEDQIDEHFHFIFFDQKSTISFSLLVDGKVVLIGVEVYSKDIGTLTLVLMVKLLISVKYYLERQNIITIQKLMLRNNFIHFSVFYSQKAFINV